MTALIGFVRELSAELIRRADALDADTEGKVTRDPDTRDAVTIVLAASTVLRQFANAINVAAKKTLFT